jgi:signal transduction histidine kinase
MPVHSPSAWARHLVAAALVVLATALTFLVEPLEHAPSPPFLAAVALAAWYGGLGPGILATALSVLALDFFFVSPVYSFGVGLVDGVRMGTFILVAVLLSSLDAARRRLETGLRQRDRRRAEFLATMAHELRNFLAAATNALNVLGTPGLDPTASERSRGLLDRQLRSMSRLISDLLDLARIDQGKVHLQHEVVDLARTVAHAVEAVQPAMEGRGHRVDLTLPAGPAIVVGDATRLEQVFFNLLSNACKYTEPGGHIQVTCERSDSESVVRVKDNGIGISAEDLVHVFDLFAQAEPGARGGLGVGLALARGLIRLQGGDVTAASAGPGKGSEFVVHLPLCKEPSAGGPAVQADFPRRLSPAGRRPG